MTSTIRPAAAPIVGAGTAIRHNLAYDPQPANVSYREWQPRYSFVHTWQPNGGPFSGAFPFYRYTAASSQSIIGRGWDTYGNADASSPGTTADPWLSIPVTSGQPITINYYVRTSIACTWEPLFRIHNGLGAWLTTATGTGTTSVSANTWTLISRVYTPTATGFLVIRQTASAGGTIPSGGTIDGSRMMIEYGNPGDNYYFDGFSGVNYTTSWAWDGAPGNSRSTQYNVTRWILPPWSVPDAVSMDSAKRESRNTVHQLIGGGVAIALIEPDPRSGEMTLHFTSRSLADDAYNLHSAETTFTLENSEHGSVNMAYAAMGVSPPEVDADWMVRVTFQEIEV